MQHVFPFTRATASRAHPTSRGLRAFVIAGGILALLIAAMTVEDLPAEGPLSIRQREALADDFAAEHRSATTRTAQQSAQFTALERPSRTLVGLVRARLSAGGAQDLSAWRLEAQSLRGERLSREFPRGASTAEIALPLGSWRVRPVAGGYTARAQLVSLTRETAECTLSFEFESAVTAIGELRDSSGAALAHTRLSLESCIDGWIFTTVTAGDGSFVFEDVLCGEYRWSAGETDEPLDVEKLQLRRIPRGCDGAPRKFDLISNAPR